MKRLRIEIPLPGVEELVRGLRSLGRRALRLVGVDPCRSLGHDWTRRMKLLDTRGKPVGEIGEDGTLRSDRTRLPRHGGRAVEAFVCRDCSFVTFSRLEAFGEIEDATS